MSTPAEFVPRRSRSPLERRYWAAVYLARRLVFLALILWSAITCAVGLAGPHPVAAAAGLVCALVVLYVQGGWVWRRYRRWVTRA
ncbi:hypothetical protein ABZ249_29865 [Nocardiopsis sp. NPDC006139]|uniref:hypothetical protein n=1 Tax=Nocardiopsis sp. NPDC006139 TaxID=3154578 RepID=UPI0033B392A0